MVWPRVNIDREASLGVALLCIQRDGLPMQIIELRSPEFRAALSDQSVRSIDKTVVYPSVRTRSRGGGRTAWSDMRIETVLVLRQSFDWSGATGLAITPAQEREVFEYLQASHGAALPAELRTASESTISVWSRDGLVFNGLRAGALLIAWLAAAFGVWRIIRAEKRYRRWVLTNCAYCGYSLEGLTTQRCPECGKARMPRWR